MSRRSPARIAATIPGLLLVLAAGCTKTASPDLSAVASDSPFAQAIPKVADLHAHLGSWSANPGTWGVSLSWQAPTGFNIDHYVVGRDGTVLADGVSGTTYRDERVAPGASYHYELAAVIASGAHSPASTITVATTRLPTGDARLQGRFVVKLNVTKASVNLKNGSMYWAFAPKCRSGPCATRWAAIGRGSKGTLGRRGARYRGSATGPFLILDCNGHELNERLDLDLRVASAHVIAGAWRASRFTGTLHESAPPVGNCQPGSASYRVSGSLG